MPFLIIFILAIFLELYVFIEVGDAIGAGFTLLLTLLSIVFGVGLIRQQGTQTVMSMQNSFRTRKEPMVELFDNFCIVIAAILLILPGFITDLIGIMLLIPPIREVLRGRLARRMNIHPETHSNKQNDPHYPTQVIEAEYTRIEDEEDEKR